MVTVNSTDSPAARESHATREGLRDRLTFRHDSIITKKYIDTAPYIQY